MPGVIEEVTQAPMMRIDKEARGPTDPDDASTDIFVLRGPPEVARFRVGADLVALEVRGQVKRPCRPKLASRVHRYGGLGRPCRAASALRTGPALTRRCVGVGVGVGADCGLPDGPVGALACRPVGQAVRPDCPGRSPIRTCPATGVPSCPPRRRAPGPDPPARREQPFVAGAASGRGTTRTTRPGRTRLARDLGRRVADRRAGIAVPDRRAATGIPATPSARETGEDVSSYGPCSKTWLSRHWMTLGANGNSGATAARVGGFFPVISSVNPEVMICSQGGLNSYQI